MNLSVFYLILLLSILQLASCATEENSYREYKGRIKVEGKAVHGKNGPLVRVNDSLVYLLRGGPDYWDQSQSNNNVKVKGRFFIETYPQHIDSVIWIQNHYTGNVIERSKVKLIE